MKNLLKIALTGVLGFGTGLGFLPKEKLNSSDGDTGEYHPCRVSAYPETLLIIDIDEEHDTAWMVDGNGFEWAMSEPEDLLVGDFVSVLMSNNGTLEVFDDQILSVHYAGFWLERGEVHSCAELVSK